jgi:dipeptidyl aminopeptidase/acylaminoacyl peptidase
VRRLRKFVLFTTAAILIYLSLSSAIGIVAVESALHPARRALTPADQAQARALAAQNHADVRQVSIPAQDGVTLSAWQIRPAAANGDTVLLLHGQADNRAGVLSYAALLLSRGYSVLLPDARAHGESAGPIATYGVLEAEDIHR